MSERFRILTVCAANQCRSPLAAHRLRSGLAHADALVVVESAGVAAYDVSPMCAEAAAWANVDAAAHRSRQVDPDMLRSADLILVADRSHRAYCARELPECRPRLFTMRQAAVLAEALEVLLSAGDLPEGAPALPQDPRDRLTWFAAELHAGRGLTRHVDEEHDDIEDRHGDPDHHETFEEVDEAMSTVLSAMRLVLSMP